MDVKDEAKLVFRILDVDFNGKISETELADGLRCMGLNPSLKEVRGLLEEFDEDRDGMLGLEEFLKLFRKFSGDCVGNEEIERQFKEMDGNGDGVVSVEELKKVLMEGEEALSEEEVMEVLRKFDKDRSGTIELGEFIKGVLG